MRVVFLLAFVSNVSYGFFESLSKQRGISLKVICYYKVVPNGKRKTYYNDFIFDYNTMEKEVVNMLIKEADVIVYSLHKKHFSSLNKKAIVFRLSERKFKQSINGVFDYIYNYFSTLYHCSFLFRRSKPYLLAIGGYTYGDYFYFHGFRNRAYKFAYLGDIDNNIEKKLLLEKHKSNFKKIIWVGSMDYDKKLLETLETLNLLIKNGYRNFNFSIFGNGYLMNKYINYVRDNKLSDYVSFRGEVPIELIKEELKKSHLFIASGGRNEGFNCTILRAFNYYCVCLCNEACGSTIDLITNGYNGFSFNSFTKLYNLLIHLLSSSCFETICSISANAYSCLVNEWNCELASRRFSLLAKSLLNKTELIFDSGVLSKAEPIINIKKSMESE